MKRISREKFEKYASQDEKHFEGCHDCGFHWFNTLTVATEVCDLAVMIEINAWYPDTIKEYLYLQGSYCDYCDFIEDNMLNHTWKKFNIMLTEAQAVRTT